MSNYGNLDIQSAVHLSSISLCTQCQHSVGHLIEQTLMRAISLERDRLQTSFNRQLKAHEAQYLSQIESQLQETLSLARQRHEKDMLHARNRYEKGVIELSRKHKAELKQLQSDCA